MSNFKIIWGYVTYKFFSIFRFSFLEISIQNNWFCLLFLVLLKMFYNIQHSYIFPLIFPEISNRYHKLPLSPNSLSEISQCLIDLATAIKSTKISTVNVPLLTFISSILLHVLMKSIYIIIIIIYFIFTLFIFIYLFYIIYFIFYFILYLFIYYFIIIIYYFYFYCILYFVNIYFHYLFIILLFIFNIIFYYYYIIFLIFYYNSLLNFHYFLKNPRKTSYPIRISRIFFLKSNFIIGNI